MKNNFASVAIIFLFIVSHGYAQVGGSGDPGSEDEFKKVFSEIVLLKNHGRILPLAGDDITSIALIGPCISYPGIVSGPPEAGYVSLYEGLKSLVGDSIDLYSASGINMINDIIPVDSSVMYLGQGVNGYSVKYYDKPEEASGSPAAFGSDKFIDHYWTDPPITDLDSTYSVRWETTLIPRHGPVKVRLIHSDGCRLFLDGELLIDAWEAGPVRADSAWLNISEGASHNLRIDFFSDGQGPAVIRFGFDYLVSNMLFEAVEKAKRADVAIVVVGQTARFMDDGMLAANYQIPRQSRLVREIYEANPNTIVILQTLSAVDIESWAFKVPAIIQAGMPGSNTGKDIANVLMGKENPYGKLPYRWTMNWNQNFATRFPYGHGMSYTTFGIGKLMMNRKPGSKAWDATVEIRNMGASTGTEMLQVYLRRIDDIPQTMNRKIKSYKLVTLLPGQKKIVALEIPYDAFGYYDQEHGKWVIEPGLYEVMVGVSSEAIKLRKRVELKAENLNQH